jgi:hypothetical protein
MGIKFHCPKGHKLNVKAFLAGKKGVCPKCGTKVRIPLQSEAGLVDSDLEETDASQGPARVQANAAQAPAKSNGSGAVTAPAAVAAVAPATGHPAIGSDRNDPIAEAPAAIWYVRPPTGGQYGPAKGEIMRKWIAEGRVSSDSLVWREGWTDWQNAGKLFPTLQAAGSAAQNPASVVSTTVPISPRATVRAATRGAATAQIQKKSNSNALAIAVLVGLALVCAVLGTALVYVAFYLK